MLTVSELARMLNVTPATIRRWSGEFGKFLSDAATPPKGETRLYSDTDAAALALVGEMRRAGADLDTICDALAAGELGQLPNDTQQDDNNTLALVTQITARAASLEGELKATMQERDYLRQQVETAQAAAQDAEKRAIVAETKLQAVSILQGAETPAAGNVTGQGATWRERLARWIAGEGGNE